jgi:basic amino acid/polyamine antiporter, APA family
MPSEPQPDLRRALGFWPVVSVVVGTIIGSGIFRVPGGVAADVGTIAGIAAVWLIGGVITLCGALALAELAAALPRTGGVFVYLHEAYGPGAAFLYGWTLLVVGPSASAAVAMVFAEYLTAFVALTPLAVRGVAISLIVFVSAAGYRSARGAGHLQTVAAAAKVTALAGLVGVALVISNGADGSFGSGAPITTGTQWGGVGTAMVAVLWAYNGFQDMVSVAGEVRDPARVLPRALIAGTLAVVCIYVIVNVAYLWVLPFTTLSASPLVASDVGSRLLGRTGATTVAVMVMVSTFGTVNGAALANPRVFYAMAREHLLFEPLGRAHHRYATPHVAVTAHALLAVLFVTFRTFEQLAELFVIALYPLLALAVGGVIVLRHTRPDLSRPYRTPAYPIVCSVFLLGTAWIVASTLWANPMETSLGLGMMLLGLPIYYVWRAMRGTLPARSAPL